jgi:ferredoxin
MKRNIIRIDENLCDGCGLCVEACHEGAIALIDGKARLVSETYCDGLGNCLGECPRGAITIEERNAMPYDNEAVKRRQVHDTHPAKAEAHGRLPCGCPGSMARTLKPAAVAAVPAGAPAKSALGQWPIQLRLVNPSMPFLQGADLLLCADCAPCAIPDFHQRYLAGRAIAAIFEEAHPRSITVLRMEVPCCGGLAHAAHQAMEKAGLDIPVEIHVIRIEDGSAEIEPSHSHACS